MLPLFAYENIGEAAPKSSCRQPVPRLLLSPFQLGQLPQRRKKLPCCIILDKPISSPLYFSSLQIDCLIIYLCIFPSINLF